MSIKAHLANERTFLHWLSLCLVVGALGIALLDYGSIPISLMFMVVSVGFMVYALIQYHHRASLIGSKSKGLAFQDIHGAIAMVCAVFVAIGVNFVLKWQ
jgi:uncharacterized membrane protein YidH (DUF202 family)